MANVTGYPGTPHGWVIPLPDGAVARCGGPGMCVECQAEQKWVQDRLFELDLYRAKQNLKPDALRRLAEATRALTAAVEELL